MAALTMTLWGAITIRADVVSITDSVTVGSQPYAIALDSVTNMIYVANSGDGTVTAINGATNSVAATIGVQSKPWAIAVNPVTAMIYTTNSGSGTVSVINSATNSVKATIGVGSKPVAVAVDPVTDMIYTANMNGNSVSVINGATNSVTTTIGVGSEPYAIVVDPVTNMIYVANYGGGTVTAINGATNSVTATITAGSSPLAIAVNLVTDMIYAVNYGGTTVTAINGLNNTTKTITVGSYPDAIAVDPVTNMIYVANMNQPGTVSAIYGAKNDSVATIAVGGDPDAIGLNPITDMIYVANMSDNTVTVINGSNNATTTLAAGGNPYGIAVNILTNTTYDLNTQTYNVSVITGSLPGQVVLVSPSTNATNVPLATTLSWNAATRATSYTVQVSTNSAFSPTILSSSGSINSIAASLKYATKYYWIVTPSNASGSTTGTKDSFTTAMVPPGAPALASPTNGAVNQPVSGTLTWGTVATATSYEVQMAASSAFDATIFDQSGLTQTISGPGGLANATLFYWRANASNEGSAGVWSTIWSFTTVVAAPPAPVLSLPSNGSTGEGTALTLSWSSVSGTVASYTVQVSTGSAFANTVFVQTGLALIEAAGGLVNGGTYYWRANASNAGGTTWSGAWSFSTLGIPSAPLLSMPTNGATNVALPLTLMWGSSAWATSYGAEVSLGTSLSTTIYYQAGISGNSQIVPANSSITYGTTYSWGVWSANAIGQSGMSNEWTFSTITAPAPGLSSPSNGATYSKGASLMLSWGSVNYASSYAVQVSSTSNFSNFALSNTTSSTSYQFTPNPSLTYFWRVCVYSSPSSVYGAWSGTWTFAPSVSMASSVSVRKTCEVSIQNGRIAYSLPNAELVEIVLYDILGRTVMALNRHQAEGSYSVDLKSTALAAGLYEVRFRVGSLEKSATIILNR